MALPELNLSATCPKCGHDDIGIAYRWKYSVGCDTYCGGKGRAEHQDRWCKRCHYQWAEACLTSGSGEGESRDQ